MHKQRKKGFTLIELLLVVAISTIMMGITFCNMGFFDRALLHAELNKLHAVCQYAQRCAIVSNKKQEIMFNKAAKTYTFNGRKETLHTSVDFGFVSSAKGPPSSPSKPITSPITFKNSAITFEPNGIIQPGTVYLVDVKKESMCALSCGISSISFLRKYRYDKRWRLM